MSSRLVERDDGFAAVVVVEGDLLARHGADVRAGVGGDECGFIRVREAEQLVQAVHLLRQADGAVVLDERQRHLAGGRAGGAVVFQQHVA